MIRLTDKLWNENISRLCWSRKTFAIDILCSWLTVNSASAVILNTFQFGSEYGSDGLEIAA
jgi:hypothetical protein